MKLERQVGSGSLEVRRTLVIWLKLLNMTTEYMHAPDMGLPKVSEFLRMATYQEGQKAVGEISKLVADGAGAAAQGSRGPDLEEEKEGQRSGSCQITAEASPWFPGFCSSSPPPHFPVAAVSSQHISQRDPAEQESTVCCSSAQSPSMAPTSLGVKIKSR